jgi:hypothetical protein
MDIKWNIERTSLATCNQTYIENDLLEALIVNKRGAPKYSDINPIVYGGHNQGFPARQVLSYLFRLGLGVVRRPGAYDIRMDCKHFARFSNEELIAAAEDVRRINEHTFSELKAHYRVAVPLVRGIGGVEAAVCARLLDECTNDLIPYFFQTLNFFNHVNGAHRSQIEIRVDCPVDWIWASAYTLKELELPGGSCEEFIVVCRSIDGVLNIPKENFTITPCDHRIEDISVPYRGSHFKAKDCALNSALTVGEVFEPDNASHTFSHYNQGKWERRFAAIGRKLDQKRKNEYYKGRIVFLSRE